MPKQKRRPCQGGASAQSLCVNHAKRHLEWRLDDSESARLLLQAFVRLLLTGVSLKKRIRRDTRPPLFKHYGVPAPIKRTVKPETPRYPFSAPIPWDD
jgi:hypothetical protein